MCSYREFRHHRYRRRATRHSATQMVKRLPVGILEVNTSLFHLDAATYTTTDKPSARDSSFMAILDLTGLLAHVILELIPGWNRIR